MRKAPAVASGLDAEKSSRRGLWPMLTDGLPPGTSSRSSPPTAAASVEDRGLVVTAVRLLHASFERRFVMLFVPFQQIE